MAINLRGRNFLKLLDFYPEEILALLELSRDLKKAKQNKKEEQFLRGKNIALIFEKDSTRTRCAFETAAFDQGAHVTYLGPTSSHIGTKESMKDTARVLGRMFDGIQYRGFGQNIVEELGEHAGVPVWNGLTDEFHPTQVLADFMTMQEHCQKPLQEMSLCYLGDGRNNVANSLMIGAARMGMDFRIASPHEFQPEENFTNQCAEIADETGAHILITDDVIRGIEKADFLYTDVWVSMGEPESAWEKRIELLKPYQVNADIIDVTSNPDVRFLHCLPAFHNRQTKIGEEIYQKFGLESLEVTEEVFESDRSVVFDQAENRLHTIKAIMVATLS